MDNQSNTWGWVVGIVIVVLVVLGIWWAMGAGTPGGTSPTATSTPTGAATTTSGGIPVVSETRTGTAASVAANLPGASRFATLLSSTGVGASLTGAGPYTIFVPTDEAYASVAATLNGMSAAQLKRVAQYHVVSGKMLDVDAVSSGTYVALSKDTINFNVRAQDKSVFVNSAYVIRQYKASNGIVYLIGGAVLLPPQAASSTGSSGAVLPR